MHAPKAPGVVLASAGLVFAADQIAKAMIRHELTLCSAPPVSLCDRVTIAGPLGLLWTQNGDGAFGLLAGEAIGPVMIVLLGILLWHTTRLRWTPVVALAVGLQFGGLLANLFDRALFGAVTDFIDVRLGPGEAGIVLNPADVGLALGGVVLALLLYQGGGRRTLEPLAR
jgi:lipoprotein signal peptidase